MGYLRPVIRTMLLLFGLVASGCASDDGAGTETKSHGADFECPDTSTTTTTTTGVTTTSIGLPSVCELIADIPADELPPEGVRDYVVWSGTISGSIQATPDCEVVSQSGEIILVVFSDGSLSGAGETVAGAHACSNGVTIPEMTNSYGINGRMTDVFTLTFTDGVQLASEPIESGHALITQDTGYGLVTIMLVCENC